MSDQVNYFCIVRIGIFFKAPGQASSQGKKVSLIDTIQR